jgi:hypothetical protein
MSGRGVIGRDCAWCGLPAVGELEIQPAQYRTVTRRDPLSGSRTTHQRLLQAAIVVAVCDTHQHITSGQPAPVAVPCQRHALEVEQLGLFAVGTEARVRTAIYRETGR